MSELGDIQTLVVLMFENRSFDNVLGHLSHPRFGRRHDIDGLGDPSKTIEYDNYCDNEVFRPCPTRDGPLDFDLPHDRESIAQQMDLQNGVPTMGGFVEAYRAKAPDRRVCSAPMSFLRPQDVPSTGFIAEHFAVCDRWFSPIASGTQPNRAMAFTGSSRIDDNLDLPVLKAIPHRPKELVFRWLSERRVPWRVYHSGLSFFSLFGNVLDLVLGPGFRNVRSLHSDMLKAPDADDPRVIFIEPEYGDSPVHLATPNDNHPPLAMAPGEIFLQQVYEALTLNPDRWAKTLFVVTYDEHGGFFDHVIPPKVHHLPAYAKYTKAFTFAGPRVPALVASPHVAPRSVCHATLDHTSVLQLIAELFAGGPKNYSSDVSRRRAQGIQSLSVVLRPDGPGGLPPKMASRPVAVRSQVHTGVKAPSNPNQAAFALAGRALLKQDRSAALDRFPELAHLAEEGISEDG